MDTTTQVAKIAVVIALLTHGCLLTCHPTSWRTYHKLYLPGPQFCPETGRTVCAAVDYYPTDKVYHILTSTRSQLFNLSSLFVDERKGDVEPNIAQLPTQPPYHQDSGYGVNQPPPGGRFSPAGHNSWNTATSGRPPGYPTRPQDQWRQVTHSHNNNNNGGNHANNGGNHANNGGNHANSNGGNHAVNPRRQARDQSPANQRNFGRNPNQHYNYISNPRQNINGDGYFGYPGAPQHNRIEPHFDYPQPFHNGGNFSGYHRSGVHMPQGPYQIQPPYTTKRNLKGHSFFPTVAVRPQGSGNWKGSPAYIEPDRRAEVYGPALPSRFNAKRERRNQDVEVACQVQSTYVPPRAALSDQSEWKFIVNVPERDRRFSQVVRVDVCLNEGQPCSSRLSLPFGFESRCRQKYIKKKLLSLNADGQGTSEDNFFIPSCCVCEITRLNRK